MHLLPHERHPLQCSAHIAAGFLRSVRTVGKSAGVHRRCAKSKPACPEPTQNPSQTLPRQHPAHPDKSSLPRLQNASNSLRSLLEGEHSSRCAIATLHGRHRCACRVAVSQRARHSPLTSRCTGWKWPRPPCTGFLHGKRGTLETAYLNRYI